MVLYAIQLSSRTSKLWMRRTHNTEKLVRGKMRQYLLNGHYLTMFQMLLISMLLI